MSKRGSGSSERAGGFSKAQKAAISKFEQYVQKKFVDGQSSNLLGNINYKKGEGERIEATFTTQRVFRDMRGGKMVSPENYDVVERTTKRTMLILASESGKVIINNSPLAADSTDKILSRHYYRAPKRKK